MQSVNPNPGKPLYGCSLTGMLSEGHTMPFDGVELLYNPSLQKMDAVIDLLATPDKWCKGALRSHDGRHCIRGAVRAVDGAELLEPPILQAIGEVAGRRFRRIESFNDHPNTSHEQVMAVLVRARDNIRVGRPLGAVHTAGQTTTSWRTRLFGWFAG